MANGKCDICKCKSEYVVDGKTHHGPWADMCDDCYTEHGTGLGTYVHSTTRKKVIPSIKNDATIVERN